MKESCELHVQMILHTPDSFDVLLVSVTGNLFKDPKIRNIALENKFA
jgi:hypothetical protein